MTCSCGLARVDMSDDHDVDVGLLLSHLARLSQNKPRVSTSLPQHTHTHTHTHSLSLSLSLSL
jgi:hypothetical protein